MEFKFQASLVYRLSPGQPRIHKGTVSKKYVLLEGSKRMLYIMVKVFSKAVMN